MFSLTLNPAMGFFFIKKCFAHAPEFISFINLGIKDMPEKIKDIFCGISLIIFAFLERVLIGFVHIKESGQMMPGKNEKHMKEWRIEKTGCTTSAFGAFC